MDFAIPGREIRTEKRKECFVPTEMFPQYFSGTNVYGPDDYMVLLADFKGAPGDEDVTNEVCEEAAIGITIAEDIIGIFLPELRPALAELGGLVKMGCADVEEFKKATEAVSKATSG